MKNLFKSAVAVFVSTFATLGGTAAVAGAKAEAVLVLSTVQRAGLGALAAAITLVGGAVLKFLQGTTLWALIKAKFQLRKV